MRPLVYSLQFRGEASPIAPGLLGMASTAPGGSLFTTIDGDGLHASFEVAAGEEATFRSRLSFTDELTFSESGTIVLEGGHALHLRTVGTGVLGPSPDPHLRHGTVMWEVEDGEGQFEQAEGRITSNFFLSDTGELTDNQIGVIFAKPLP